MPTRCGPTPALNRLKNASIGARLGGAFALRVAVVIAMAAITKLRTAAMAEDVQRLVADNDVKVRRVGDPIGEIASAAHEQSSGIGQVKQAVAPWTG